MFFFFFFGLYQAPPSLSHQYLCHGSEAACLLPPLWLLEFSHAQSPQGSMDKLLYCKYSLLSLPPICKHAFAHTVHICTRGTHALCKQTSGQSFLVVTFAHLNFLRCEWRNLTLDRWFQFNSHPLNLFTPHWGEICYRLFSPCHSS